MDFEFTGMLDLPSGGADLYLSPLSYGGIYPVDVLDKSRLPSSQWA